VLREIVLGLSDSSMRCWLEEVRRQQPAVTYRSPFSIVQDLHPEIGQDVYFDMENHISQDPVSLSSVYGHCSESSRGLGSSPMYTSWPGEEFLRHRYSSPNFPSKQRMLESDRPNTISRSTS